ncbi:restriction endonuclease [Ancylomarina sp.]|uniref:restriction endonuclease n=1 Tax=Ancylomarina sp. TaxID=1970196 RepID=UPI003563FBC6
MEDVVSYNIYEKYPDLSKAKMLREFLKDESESYVGKAIVLLINHMKDCGLVEDNVKDKVDRLQKVGERFLGKTQSNRTFESTQINKKSEANIDFKKLKDSLLDIESISPAQTRGYAFEKYLNELFSTFNLDPHASYRTDHDQIDGSFKFGSDTVLVEAKYKAKEITKDDLILFERKIESKSHFVKGLFITFSSISNKAKEYFKDSGSRIIVLTVEEIFLMCQNEISLITVLEKKYRELDERGLIFKHILQLV